MTTKRPPDPLGSCVDGDLLAFKAACFVDKHGIEFMEERLTQDLKLWDAGVGDQVVTFSCSRKDNYRRDFWPAYKAHRDGKPGPDSLQAVRQWIVDNHPETLTAPRIEADDLMGIFMSNGFTCVTKDKDLKSVPGWFWDPETGFPMYHDEDEADLLFHKQWLTGDTADNIAGIHRCGPKAADRILEGVPFGKRSERVMNHYLEVQYDTVKWKVKDQSYSGSRSDLLEQKYGWTKGHGEEYALSQARCIRILREGEWDAEAQEPLLWTP